MPRLNTLEVPVDDVAALVHVQPETIRRRLRAGELKAAKDGGRVLVVLDPKKTWLRVEDAGAMLGVTAATVRGTIRRGELAGRRERGGRWRVRLESVLADRRCNPNVVARFGGELPPVAPTPEPSTSVHRLRRDVFVRLDADDVALFEDAWARHGTQHAAVVAGLHADAAGATPSDVAELRTERDLYRDAAEQARERAAVLSELARRRLVDALYCPRCERLVPIEEAGYEVEEGGTVAIFHEPHGYHVGGRVRGSTVMARRAGLASDAEDGG